MDRNRGPGGCRNVGVGEARAELLAFQDSDDEWGPQKLERQLCLLEARGPDVGVVYCDMLRVRADGVGEPHHSPPVRKGRWIDPETGFYSPYGLGIQTCLIRRVAYERAGGFREELRCFEDLELFLRLLLDWEFALIPEALVRYHETVGGQTTKWREELKTRRRIVWESRALLLRESPSFWFREAALVGLRTLLGPGGGRLPGRPFGPPLRKPAEA